MAKRSKGMLMLRQCVDCGVDVTTGAYRCEPCHIAWKHRYQAELLKYDPSYCYCPEHEALAEQMDS